MSKLEDQIVGLIVNNKYLDENEKAKYIAAMMLMTEKKQKGLLKRLQKYSARCKAIEEGHFTLTKKETGIVQSIFESIKKRLFLKAKIS